MLLVAAFICAAAVVIAFGLLDPPPAHTCVGIRDCVDPVPNPKLAASQVVCLGLGVVASLAVAVSGFILDPPDET